MPAATPSSLNEIEQKILEYMVSYLRANTYQPSIREIGQEFGIRSTKTVSEHLQSLAEKGHLERDASRSRGVKILGVDLNGDAVSVPCLRRLPTSDEVSVESSMQMDRKVTPAGCFGVRARGDELAALGVEAGDLVFVQPVDLHSVPDGSAVAFEREGRAAYARIRRVPSGFELHSTRSAQGEAEAVGPEEIQLSGRIVAFLRQVPEPPLGGVLTAH